MVITYRPAFRQPRLNIHLLIEFRQAFAECITHYNPAEIILCRFKRIGKVRYTEFQSIFINGGIIGAAAGDNAGG